MNVLIKVLWTSVMIFSSLPAGLSSQPPPVVDHGILSQSKNLGDCQACQVFVKSFKNGLERTARGKYEGGDAAWEEEKLKKSYTRSEIRLVDIQEGICQDTKHSVQCHQYAEKAEELIEQWWAQDPDESDDLHTYVCIDNLKVCCPAHHYGKDCLPCPGDHQNLCSGKGRCKWDGSRKGNGLCHCFKGYTGDNCDKCDIGYYLSEDEEDKKLTCQPCHFTCEGGCTGSTSLDCKACKDGYSYDEGNGCVDINECKEPNICKTDEYCDNTMGSYACKKCHKRCNQCHGEGPSNCYRCAEGFARRAEPGTCEPLTNLLNSQTSSLLSVSKEEL